MARSQSKILIENIRKNEINIMKTEVIQELFTDAQAVFEPISSPEAREIGVTRLVADRFENGLRV